MKLDILLIALALALTPPAADAANLRHDGAPVMARLEAHKASSIAMESHKVITQTKMEGRKPKMEARRPVGRKPVLAKMESHRSQAKMEAHKSQAKMESKIKQQQFDPSEYQPSDDIIPENYYPAISISDEPVGSFPRPKQYVMAIPQAPPSFDDY